METAEIERTIEEIPAELIKEVLLERIRSSKGVNIVEYTFLFEISTKAFRKSNEETK